MPLQTKQQLWPHCLHNRLFVPPHLTSMPPLHLSGPPTIHSLSPHLCPTLYIMNSSVESASLSFVTKFSLSTKWEHGKSDEMRCKAIHSLSLHLCPHLDRCEVWSNHLWHFTGHRYRYPLHHRICHSQLETYSTTHSIIEAIGISLHSDK